MERKIIVVSFGKRKMSAQIIVIENGVSNTRHIKRVSPSLWYSANKIPYSNTMLGIK